jgi:hypothetical protein
MRCAVKVQSFYMLLELIPVIGQEIATYRTQSMMHFWVEKPHEEFNTCTAIALVLQREFSRCLK